MNPYYRDWYYSDRYYDWSYRDRCETERKQRNEDAMDNFYLHKPVIMWPEQIRPGVKATEYFGCSGPNQKGQKIEFTSAPYKHYWLPSVAKYPGDYCYKADYKYQDSLGYWHKSHGFLRDHGVGANYNKNRWVLDPVVDIEAVKKSVDVLQKEIDRLKNLLK
jgi:hypothetical protein